MVQRMTVFAALGSALLGALSLALAQGVADPDPGSAFSAFLSAHRTERQIPSLSVAVGRNGELVFAQGYGFQDHDGEEPTTANTTYLAASITKTFTGATLLAMAEDGHIDLQADFTTLSDWDRRCTWLTTSGVIFGGATLDSGLVIEPIDCKGPITLEQVLSHRVNGRPGTDFLYNPIVFGRLSNFVEERTGTPWRDWVTRYVLAPGKLERTAAGWRHPARGHVLTDLAPPFRHLDKDNDGQPDDVEPSVLPNTELNASSGIIADAPDLVRYAMAMMDDKILPRTLKERLWQPPRKPGGEPEPYAYGWYVQEWEGKTLVWHGGWWPDAYAGLLLLVPEQGLALAALGNTDGLYWGNPLNDARVETSPVAAKFLELYAERP